MKSSRNNALIQAINGDDIAQIKDLLMQGVAIDGVRPGSTTPLMYAAQKGNQIIVQLLLEAGATVNQQRQPEGLSALMLAGANNHLSIVKMLLESGAEVNQTNEDGSPVLAIAAYRGYLELVRYLITVGANVNLQDKQDDVALTLAIAAGHQSVVTELLMANADPLAGKGALSVAIRYKQHQILAWLLSQGVDPDTHVSDARPPLMEAVKAGDPDMVTRLLEAGATLALGMDGETPLTLAASQGNARGLFCVTS